MRVARSCLAASLVLAVACSDDATSGGEGETASEGDDGDPSGIDVDSSAGPSDDGTAGTVTSGDTTAGADATTVDDSTGSTGDTRPIVIVMIGDGMGRAQLDTTSVYAHGDVGGLFLQSLPVHGEIVTGSLSGTTDSAAAATTMATGRKTTNGRIGMDEHGAALTTIVEDANMLGLATGVVTTAYVPHATPGGFTAHRASRHDLVGIADDQALVVQPHVLLGGGAAYYLPAGPDSHRTDDGLLAPLESDGYTVVYTADELASERARADRIVGLFAAEHMDYVVDRADDTTQPTLTEMAMAALEVLDRDEDGFVLVIEGARIDMAGHANDIERSITETLAFDDAVATVAEWADSHEDVTLLVTADHECGGLVPDPAAVKGVLPDVGWRWGEHTNARIEVFGRGPGAEWFDGEVRDHAWVHALVQSRITGEALVEPAKQLAPDGHLAELRHQSASQIHESSYGLGHNQLDALWLDADASGLAIGVEGLFKWDRNTVVVLVDVDFGAATGFDGLAGELTDHDGVIDDTLATVALTASNVPGFGADFALASFGGRETRREDLLSESGLRGLHPPIGQPYDLAWLAVGADFGEGVRVPQGVAGDAVPGEGLEMLVPWTVFFPDLDGDVPPGTSIAVVVVLANDDGSDLSNQTLPPLPDDIAPGAGALALPGVVEYLVDMDADGIADGDAEPLVHTP
jgi:alkaline phosphatase